MSKLYLKLSNTFYKLHIYFRNKSVESSSKDVKETFKKSIYHTPTLKTNLSEVFDPDQSFDAPVVLKLEDSNWRRKNED